eukprot:TRINITY_DN68639_c0_g1_i1.p1 TRINITY_DN68639_c0_g1~~TRINITY_DN68639_c0_g1_i1.p1  ORF type:complete len:1218 (-),score=141.06 TRINITY_DN68639_c0_g1_i1:58-3609(-)
MAACEHLVEVVSKGTDPEVCGAVLLATGAVESFKQLIGGPMDTLAANVAKVMIALVQFGGYPTHMHLLQNLGAVIGMLGDTSASTLRILWLSELFVAMTQQRTPEVIDALIEQKGIEAFLSLGKSNLASRRDLVQKWLEAYGSSVYEIDEVSEAFRISTTRGLLFISSRCALPSEDAQNLRRIIFSLVYRRVVMWRKSVFGVGDYLTEDLMSSLVPMCELQPDLVAALLSLWHELLMVGEIPLLDRVWTGGSLAWICRRMSHKSGLQMAAARASGSAVAPIGKPWDRHEDLITAQGIATRLLWHFYETHSVDFIDRAVKKECVVKNWKEFVTFYFYHAWPMCESTDLEAVTDATILLAMRIAMRLTLDVNGDQRKKLIQQGMIALACVVLLPEPQVQKEHRVELQNPPRESGAVSEPEDALMPDAKVMAGAIMARLMTLKDAFTWITERRYAAIAASMFAQLHHWRNDVFDLQGSDCSLAVVSTVSLPERQATLYLALLWSFNVEWGFEHLGLGSMATLSHVLLNIWARHTNHVMRHYSMRILSTWSQVHPIYISIMADESRAALVEQAVHQTFGAWDVRSLRQILRIVIAALAFALRIPVVPESVKISIARCLLKPDGKPLNELIREGGALRADMLSNRHLMKPNFLMQLIIWCEHPNGSTAEPGDTYGRIWALWLVLTMVAHEYVPPPSEGSPAGTTPNSSTTDSGGDPNAPLLVFYREPNPKHLERRARLLAEQASVNIGGTRDAPQAADANESPPKCRVSWLRASPRLGEVLSEICGRCVRYMWKESMIVGCLATSRLLFDIPHFLHNAVWTVTGSAVLKCLGQPEQPLNLCALNLIAVISCFRMPLKAQTVGEDFLRRFHDLQQEVIEGISNYGEGPYDLLARWMHTPLGSLPCDTSFRCLLAFMLGQCIRPPLAEAPSLSRGPLGRVIGVGGREPSPVAECSPPPLALLEALAVMASKEDGRLRTSQVKDGMGPSKGPLYSTMLVHLLYSMAVIVPLHAKAAANSAVVRSASFSQLMKVQQIVAQDIPSQTLYDPSDGDRAKLFLYLRATACIRCALQCITGSWLAADAPGSSFAITDEGSRDFIQYCSKHLNQAYNNKTQLTRVLGTPWERMMLDQGPTVTIAELMLKICSTDQNLAEVSRLGGQQALHSLSRFGETSAVRQQATMFLTKLAVMNV